MFIKGTAPLWAIPSTAAGFQLVPTHPCWCCGWWASRSPDPAQKFVSALNWPCPGFHLIKGNALQRVWVVNTGVGWRVVFRLPRGPPQAGGILTKLIHHRCVHGPPDFSQIPRPVTYIAHINAYILHVVYELLHLRIFISPSLWKAPVLRKAWITIKFCSLWYYTAIQYNTIHR